MREPGRIGAVATLIGVCLASGLLSVWLVPRDSQDDSELPQGALRKQAVPLSQQNGTDSDPAGLQDPKHAERASWKPLYPAPGDLVGEESNELADALEGENPPSPPVDERMSLLLSVSNATVHAGDEAGITIQFQTGRPVTALEFTVAYPKESLVLRKVDPSPKGFGRVHSEALELGTTRIRFDFRRPLRAFAATPLAILEAFIPRGTRPGTDIPIRLVSAKAMTPEEVSVPVKIQNGSLLVGSRDPVEGVSSPAPLTPTREEDRTAGSGPVASGTARESPALDSEVAPDPTAPPSTEPFPTPANRAPPPQRTLWLTDALGAPGEEIVISLYIDDPTDVRGVHFEVTYDASLLRYLGAQPGPLFDRFLTLDHASRQTIRVAMLGDTPMTGYWDARVCDFQFEVSDSVRMKAVGPIRLRGAHVVSAHETFRTVSHSGRLFVSPDPPGMNPNGEEGGVSNKSKLATENSRAAENLKEHPVKQPRTIEVSGSQEVPTLDRCDLDFDGVVNANDLAIFLEFLSME